MLNAHSRGELPPEVTKAVLLTSDIANVWS